MLYFNIDNPEIGLPDKAILDAFDIELYSKFLDITIDGKINFDDFFVL